MLRRLIDATGMSRTLKSLAGSSREASASGSGMEALEPRVLLSSTNDWDNTQNHSDPNAAVVVDVSQDDDALGTNNQIMDVDLVNITGSLNESKLPAAVIAGASKKITLPVTVTNNSNLKVPKNTKINITIYARPADAEDDSQDVLLTTLTSKSISDLKAGKSKTFTASITIPADLPEDSYRLVVVIDSSDVLEESSELDNELITEASIIVAEPFVNLTGSINEGKVPPAVVSGASPKVTLPVTIRNEGNVSVAKNTKIAITIVARPADAVDDSQDVVITTVLNKSISGLQAGKSKTFSLSFKLPADLAENEYTLVSLIDSENAVVESDETDNALQGQSIITVADPFVNLSLAINDAKLPASQELGSSPRVTLPLIIRNEGNVAIASKTTVVVQIYARPDWADDDSYDLLVAMVENVSVGGLKAGQSKGIKISFNLPNFEELGGYTLVAAVDGENQVEESNEDDNTAEGTKVINLTLAPRDLTVTADGSKLPVSGVAGSKTKLTLPVTVTNVGTKALPLGQVIQIKIRAVNGDAEPITVCIFNEAIVSGLKAGASKTFNLSFALPADDRWIDGQSYNFEVIVDSCYVVAESDEDNNTFITEESVIITRPGINISGSINEQHLPEHVVSGTGESILVPVTVINTGTTRLENNQKINIHVVARTNDNPETDIVVGELYDLDISRLAVGESKTFNAYITLPLQLETSSDVRLVVILDSGDDLMEINEEDNYIFSGLLDVTQGVQDLDVTFSDESGLDAEVIETVTTNALTFKLTLTNTGTALIGNSVFASIKIYARPAGADDDSSNVLITTLSSVDVSNLAMEESVELTVSNLDLSTLEAGQYYLVAVINDEVLTGSTNDNNRAISLGTFEVLEAVKDISVSIGTNTAPTGQIIETSGQKSSLTFNLTNEGNVSTVSGDTIGVKVVARPVDAMDDSQDVVIYTNTAYSVSGIAANGNKSVTLSNLDFSVLEPGQYQVIVFIDDADLLRSSDDNNTAVYNETLTIIEADMDLSLSVTSINVPQGYAEGSSDKASISVKVVNNGNLKIPASTTVTAAVYARPAGVTDNDTDILLVPAASLDVSALAVDGNKTLTISNLDLSGLGRGEYVFVVVLDDSSLPQADSTNNEAISSQSFAVEAYGADLEVTLTGVNLENIYQGEGSGENRLHVVITNVGELAVGVETTVTVSLYARPVNQGGEDYLIGEYDIDISLLTPGDYVDTLLNDLFLSELPPGTYNLVARVYDGDLSGAETYNNEAVTTQSFTVLTYSISV